MTRLTVVFSTCSAYGANARDIEIPAVRGMWMKRKAKRREISNWGPGSGAAKALVAARSLAAKAGGLPQIVKPRLGEAKPTE